MEHSVGGIKSKAYLIIIGAFIIGVVTGSLLMNLVVAKAPIPQKPTVIEELTGELVLTPDQRRKVDDIFKESRQHGKELSKIIQPQMEDIRLQTRLKVKSILTPDQQDRYEKWCTRREVDRKKSEEKR